MGMHDTQMNYGAAMPTVGGPDGSLLKITMSCFHPTRIEQLLNRIQWLQYIFLYDAADILAAS